MGSAAVCSKAVVLLLLLLVHCLLLLPSFVWGLCLVLMLYSVWCPFLFYILLKKERERAGWLIEIVFPAVLGL